MSMESENAISKSMESTFNSQLLGKLSNDVTELYKPSLEGTREQLKELVEKQTVLSEQLHDENLKLSWSQSSVDMIKMFDTVALYQGKLVAIKKEMRSIHDKISKLKKRSTKLQQRSEKLEYIQNQQLKREQDLISKSSQ